MLTFVDVKFTTIMAVSKVKGCSGLQIYSKYRFYPSSGLLAMFLDNKSS